MAWINAHFQGWFIGRRVIENVGGEKPPNEPVVNHDVTDAEKEGKPILIQRDHRDHHKKWKCISIKPPER